MSSSMKNSRKSKVSSDRAPLSISSGDSPPPRGALPPPRSVVSATIDLTGDREESTTAKPSRPVPSVPFKGYIDLTNSDDDDDPTLPSGSHIPKTSTPHRNFPKSPHIPKETVLGSSTSSKRKRHPQPATVEESEPHNTRGAIGSAQHSPFRTPEAGTEGESEAGEADSASTPSRLPMRQTQSIKDSGTTSLAPKISTPSKKATRCVVTPSKTQQSHSFDGNDEERQLKDAPSTSNGNANCFSRRSTSPQEETSQETPRYSSSPVYVRGRRISSQATASTSGISVPENAADVQQAICKNDFDVPYFLELLQSCKNTMEEQIASENKFLLEAAAESTLTMQLAFVDDVSPFASMRLDDLETGDEVQSLVTSINKSTNKPVKGTMRYVAKHVEASGCSRNPAYLNPVTTLQRNVVMLDDKNLRFVPQMPEYENTPEGQKKMAQFRREQRELYKGHLETLFTSTRYTERLMLLRDSLQTWLEEFELGLNKTILQRCLLAVDLKLTHWVSTLEEPNRETRTLIELWGDESRLARKLESLGGHLTEEDDQRAANFCVAFDRVFATPPSKYDMFDCSIRVVLFPEKSAGETTWNQISPKSSSAAKDGAIKPDRITTYAHLTCAICCTGMCQTHCDTVSEEGPQSSNWNEEGDDENNDQRIEILNLPYEDMVRKHRNKMADQCGKGDELLGDERPCSDDCFKLERISDGGYRWSPDQHSAFIKALPELLLSYTDKNHRSCHIALSWATPCGLVHDEIQKYEETHQEGQFREQIIAPLAKKPLWYDNDIKRLKGEWTELTVTHLPEERQQPSPCTHSGPCTEACPCVKNKILCEYYCACRDDCPMRFTGCSCNSSGSRMCCNSDTCICIQLNRECGPQCRSCGAIPRLKPTNRYDDGLYSTGCQNVALQRGVSKKLVIGDSGIEGAGFGLYAAEEIKKGQYVSEYKGEVISSDESERRGIFYDEKYMSFLFNLNKDWVIDATRVGNKTRFINHAKTEQEGKNVAPKIMMVNGEYRIKFTALRDIPKATELLFDYGTDFEQKHKLGKTSAGKRGRPSRGNHTTLRGTRGGGIRGGRGGNKAKKTAPSQMPASQSDDDIPVFPPDDDDDDDDDFQGPEYESEEEDPIESEQEIDRNHSRAERGRRAVRKPQRYTR